MIDGLEWFKANTDLQTAFNAIEKEHNSLNKFYKARYFAEQLNDKEKLDKYKYLLEQEQKRIDELLS